MSNRRAQDERIEGTPDGVNAITEIVDVPDAPTIGTATAGMANASVPFTAATTGGTVSTFTAISNPGSITGTSATSPITVSGLTVGTSYTFTVRGTNSTGTGPYSSSSNSIVPDPVMESAYDALATVNLSSATASITFDGIPTGYKHLQLRGITLSSSANNGIACRFNGDSGSNYAYHGLEGNGVTTTTQSYGTGSSSFVPAGYTGGSVYPSAFVCDILDYNSPTKNTSTRALTGNDDNSSGTRYAACLSGVWASTSAVTSITISHGASVNLNQYSEFALYGVK